MATPTMLEVMRSRVGITEIPGKKAHNPVIVGWSAKIGHPEILDDETSWCSICMSSAAEEAGMPYPSKAVNTMARSWLTWGVKVSLSSIKPGDVLIWPRGNPKGPFGHVNIVDEVRIYAGRLQVKCIGGNQTGVKKGQDAVTITDWKDPAAAIGIRRGIPPTVKDLRVAGSTEIKQGDTVQKVGLFTTIFGPIIAAIKDMFTMSNDGLQAVVSQPLPDQITWLQTITGGINAVGQLVIDNPWLAGTLLGGLGLAFLGSRLKSARVDKHKLGVPLSSAVREAEMVEA